ncbi:MAG: DNA mismatch repair protein MutS [Chitinophagaceae bacterium]|nr:MAG: DNA mismatch repair protein MutS [Chitinophagaceae bacterium]
MKLFPESTLAQIEFDKVKALLAAHCRTAHSTELAVNLRIHTRKEFIEEALNQTDEFKGLLQSGLYFPNDFTQNIARELKLASLPGAALTGEQFLFIKKLAENTSNIFRWFTPEKREAYRSLASLLSATTYEKAVVLLIDEVLDEVGVVKDSASEALASIRMNIYRKRQELRRAFERIASRYNKLGYLADIEESFLNGRRVLAVVAENKRMIKGVLHGESDSRRTSYIEPEETTELNNALFSLEYEEGREVQRILRALTAKMNAYAPFLQAWYVLAGDFDFIRAKALLAIDMNAARPVVRDKALVNLINAYHPLLLLYNRKAGKLTVPVTLNLDESSRILVISGPNAGGKTVTLKTIGLLQVMMQSGLLVSVSPDSEMGIFKQMFIHIGDTQSLEFELSTYSSQLKNMKYFMENANGKTMFFIDELGSGSDPNLGGAFAEVILEELSRKHAMGIVTTHYLNLKVMANKVKGIVNGAMQFDERRLLPMYKLQVGKPGSSYTFSIAERIGLDKGLIARARTLVDEEHFKLDRLLNRTEQDLQKIDKDKDQLQKLLKENERLKKEMQVVIDKETHRQEMERLRTQNKMSEEKLAYLKEMERKLKSMVVEWRRAEDKEKVVQMIQALLFKQKEKLFVSKQQKKINEKFDEVGGQARVGDTVKMKQNRQVGIVKEIRGKNAILQVGVMPMTVKLTDLVVVKEKQV